MKSSCIDQRLARLNENDRQTGRILLCPKLRCTGTSKLGTLEEIITSFWSQTVFVHETVRQQEISICEKTKRHEYYTSEATSRWRHPQHYCREIHVYGDLTHAVSACFTRRQSSTASITKSVGTHQSFSSVTGTAAGLQRQPTG